MHSHYGEFFIESTVLWCQTLLQLSYYNLNQHQQPIIINNPWWFLFYSCQGLLQGDSHAAELLGAREAESWAALGHKPCCCPRTPHCCQHCSSRTVPCEGCLSRSLKQTCSFHGKQSAQQHHSTGWNAPSFLHSHFLGSHYLLLPYSMQREQSYVLHFTWPPSQPCNSQACFVAIPQAGCSPPALHIPAAQGDQAAASSGGTVLPTGPYARCCCFAPWWHCRASLPLKCDGLHWPCQAALLGLSLQLKVAVPCSVCAQQLICNGLALGNVHG